jgi:hypothetical protein
MRLTWDSSEIPEGLELQRIPEFPELHYFDAVALLKG